MSVGRRLMKFYEMIFNSLITIKHYGYNCNLDLRISDLCVNKDLQSNNGTLETDFHQNNYPGIALFRHGFPTDLIKTQD